ncbi:hypothetical protein [Natronincola ferrireducens]|uniref:Uncharacterized protein n=1 Tax=Natronincola ferrireducens TaxID=393762 RepID=A0A1G8YKF8_9FIRM|nr:hypothetical protein [Natronincola ferrireducens]SDK02934.1 hypothetical protein SAMN05660472_00562 [Natronincola ferrireducens]
MEFIDTGTFLIVEWFKTFVIFTVVDRILMGQRIIDSLKSHNNYISSLLVAAFLMIARAQQFSISYLLFWGFIVIIVYNFIKFIKNFFLKF